MSKQEEAIFLIRELANQLADIVSEVRSTDEYESGSEKIKRWKERASKKIATEISEIEGNRLRNKRRGSFMMGNPITNLEDEANMYLGFLIALEDELTKHPEDILEPAVPVKESVNKKVATPMKDAINNCVFIVHGHDELNLLKIKEQLRDRWKLEPLVLSGQPGKGRTIIEKFEEEAKRASFAFVLLTPDDVIQGDKVEYSQARPNVIFELGWFYGCLGRKRVCILFKEGTKIHSDLDGVSRIQFKDSIEEVIVKIEKELIEAGLLSKCVT